MKKRFFSILLSLCMVLMLCPMTVFAEDGTAAELQNLLDNGGTVTLERDYTIDTSLEVNNTVTLDLNGHVIKMTGNVSVIKINSGGNLTLQDCDSEATHDDSSLPVGGVITGGNATLGGGVYIGSGSFTMNGGTIENCSASSGGGVGISSGGFTMNGGTIENCSASSGGGVYINTGSFTMYGGTIENCSGSYRGGGVYISSGGFTMSDGTIKNCSASTDSGGRGGGVHINSRGNFTMDGGTIEECNAYSGGGVGTYNGFTMNGGTIEDCSASKGGGVGIEDGSFTMSNGTIKKCSGSYSGGGVHINSSGSFTMNGGAIENCSAYDNKGGGGGVNVDNKGNFTMNGGAIENCSAEYGGGVRVVYFGSSFTSNGGIVKDTVFIGDGTSLQTASSGSYTTFYSEVKNMGTISGGVYYGGIINIGGQVTDNTYHTVHFNSNGGSSVPTQWFVNTSTAKALQPATNPTKEGYTFAGWYTDETLTNQYKFEDAVTENITLYAGFEPLTYTITYDGGDSEGSIASGTKTHGVNYTLSSETYTREGYVQTGWKDGNGREYELGDSYTIDAELTLYPVWDEIIEVPFTTTVKQGGNVAPGKTVFNLQLVGDQGENLSSEDVKVTASITTNGAGSYEGIMTITGPSEDLLAMLRDGVFVKQVNAGEDGWIYDDKVWGLRYKGEIALAYDDEILPPSSMLIFPAILVPSENGSYYEIPDDVYAVEQMSFTNTYTKSTTEPTEPTKPMSSTPTTNATTSVQTGDNSNLMLWLVLLAVSAAGVIGTGVYSRRRRSSRTK
ncbi:InlB B-repeat-containing protein [Dorea sp. YH-dor228]|uniref:InlB B-repeat-containing protein n=1 Tax=Dorea sp. YH-dor228 TaxID=3151120 RepID=UPI003242FC76